MAYPLKTTRALLALAVSILFWLVTPPCARPVAGEKNPTLQLPPLHFKTSHLANGLKVITLEDHHAPVVTLEIWYHVGSKEEPPGKHGFAHLFEHLMFKGTSHLKPGDWDRYINGVGGDDNADTYFDRTRYYETVPSNALDMVLWMEADRMANLRVDQANMVSERAVVEEEHRMDVENAPYGRQEELLLSMLYPPNHPYGHTTIGSKTDLDHATLRDVQAFHTEYYRPDNATLVLVGDFQTQQALQAIRKFFGTIPNPPSPPRRYPVPRVVQKAPKEQTVTDPLAPLPLVTLAFRIPKADDPATPVLEVISNLLSNGDSSRLYRVLVRQTQLANSVSAYPNSLQIGGWFECDVSLNAGVSPQKVIRLLQQEFATLRSQLVSPVELAKAKRQALVARIFSLLSTEEKADALGEADLYYGNPAEVNQEIASIQRVSAEDIRRVARRYFAPHLFNILIMLPPAASSSSARTSHQEDRPK
ncbi:predicted Zn-dependent peptidase [Chthonomonas calidirosea]|uniref:M16 family metallopeptidase n=1 Tax=Chthonomonas calidirosea TaxID=454171 RepID=UPI0006DD4278|nr:pitrilysin family protein [Chthonomonas calidirosea]CEK12430.1 predicted Zn-dependent peptidase [Chthonomonas calidirosea]